MNLQYILKGGSRSLKSAALWIAGACIVPCLAFAQSAVVGGLGNFDAANFEGKDANGMEIQIEGIKVSDLNPAWCGNKFGCPIYEPYATGVFIRYKSAYDAASGLFTAKTVPHATATGFAGTCYMGYAAYANAGCDHFGVHLAFTAAANAGTTTAYRWMFPDPNNPGQLIASANNIFVPTPVYTWIAPVIPTNPPVLQVEIQVPPPPPPPPAVPPQFGNATWMKVYKTDMTREVFLDELVDTNAIVPQTAAQIETDWVLLQPAPPLTAGDGRQRRTRHQNQGGVGAGIRSVLRRYETYAYTGAYNPTTHEVVCGGDGTCKLPQVNELGDLLVAQMAAANVAVPSLTVTTSGTGAGTVASSDSVISCGSKCSSNYTLGKVVTLTAKVGSNSTFTNWTGACSGTTLTCSVTVNDAVTVGAVFTASAGGGGGGGGGTTQFTLQVGRSNPGTVTSDVAGISCGSACSAKYNAGTVVTLTAAPPVGKTFVSWGGACSGTNNTCVVTMNSNQSALANFSK